MDRNEVSVRAIRLTPPLVMMVATQVVLWCVQVALGSAVGVAE